MKLIPSFEHSRTASLYSEAQERRIEPKAVCDDMAMNRRIIVLIDQPHFNNVESAEFQFSCLVIGLLELSP